MQCAILAGGLATRMRPETEHIPKALLEVAGRPFAAWQLEWLRASGVTDVVYLVGYLGEMLVEEVGDGARFGVSIEYSFDGPTLLGTGGALRLAADRDLLHDDFLVLYGDSYLDVDASFVLANRRRSGRPALMTVYRDPDRRETPNATVVNGLARYAKRSGPRPEFDGIDYGLLAFERRIVLERIPPDEVVDLSAVQEQLCAEDLMAGLVVDRRYYEIGSPAGRAELEAELSHRRG